MLVDLDVRDFAIIDHIVCRLSPGFNVLTGETGAGKSIIVDAVGQLIGERSDSTMVRSGCERAVIQGVFDLGERSDRLALLLATYGVECEPRLIVSREVSAGGGSTARINGRLVPVKALTEVGQLLVDIHGQSENTSLKRPSEHVELLDRYAGLAPERATLADLVGRLRALESDLGALRQDETRLQHRADLLAFQVEEIGLARLSEPEEPELLAERTRLLNAERLALLADRAYADLRDDEGEGAGALDQVDQAVAALESLAQIDAAMDPVRAALTAAAEAMTDQAHVLRAYRDRLEFDPVRLEAVEERLAAIADLKRKYGQDIAAVLAFAVRAAEDLTHIQGAAERIAELEHARAALLTEFGALSGAVSARRREAGERLARAVEVELEVLGMPGSRFEVVLARRLDPDGAPVDDACYGFDATGIDDVAFLVSTNPGEPPRPLVRVISGGETARLMLALKAILTAADQVPCLIFDEIDAGIGGRVGGVVGRKLWGLAERHQVLCVTHLPQVAAFGDTHLHVRKALAAGRTVTEVMRMDGDVRVDELTSMLGSETNAARRNAEQLLQQAEVWKVTERHARSRPGA
jgi:DNA repair protein RecN (Recombination protein N)